jgi:hypothetical protein
MGADSVGGVGGGRIGSLSGPDPSVRCTDPDHDPPLFHEVIERTETNFSKKN